MSMIILKFLDNRSMSCELQSMHVPVETHPGCQLENSDVVLESSVGAVPPRLFRLFGCRQIFRMDRDSDHSRQKFATVLSMPTQYIVFETTRRLKNEISETKIRDLEQSFK